MAEVLSSHPAGPQITLNDGEIRGTELTAEKGTKFFGFEGIPYAKPPLGKLRFKAPQPPEAWEGVLDATKNGNDCISPDMFTKVLGGNEDCLFINVYTPELPPREEEVDAAQKPLLPVMVWIHGGAFLSGSGSRQWYGPEYLLDLGVVLVTFNYRLGALGFLCLETADAPGNAGLKDQVAALRWVRDNIGAFGGDAGNVTIFGQSAGGASVHYLMLSEMSKGLFHKAISQSGSALSPWASQRDMKKRAFALCRALGRMTNDEGAALEFLQAARAEDLVTATASLPTAEEKRRGIEYVMVPCVEKTFPGEEAFLSEPILARMHGKFHDVPYITGYTSAECLYLIRDHKKNSNYLSDIDKDFERLVPVDMELPQKSAASLMASIKIRNFYFGSNSVNEKSLPHFVEMSTDTQFLHGIHQTVKVHSAYAKSNIYVYCLSYDKLGFFKSFLGVSFPGAGHGDDILYLFKMAAADGAIKPGSNVENTQKRILRMWTDFAKTGNPTPAVDKLITEKWEPVAKSKINYLNIGDRLTVGVNPAAKRMALWDGLYLKLKGSK